MKKKEKEELEIKMRVAVTRILLSNFRVLRPGAEKTIKKSMRKITKQTGKKEAQAAAAKK